MSLDELQTAELEAAEMASKRKTLESRRTELLDLISAAKIGKPKLPEVNANLYRAVTQVQGVLDVSRAEKTTIQIGDLVCGMSANATKAKVSGRRVFFVTDGDLKQLLSTNALELTN